MALLEVIAVSAADARAAQDGGAGRVEVAADMIAGGLTPDPGVVAAIRAATTLPLRVMLRANAGFRTSAGELDRLRRAAEALAAAGADGFVFGFLDPSGAPDAAAVGKLATEIAPLPWTFHRACDTAADCGHDAWAALHELAARPGSTLDAVLTAGSPRGLDAGGAALVRRAAEDPAAARLVLAGGGLRRRHVAALAAAGVTAFHVGRAVRRDGTFDGPVDAGLVREWRALVDAAAS
ncbi:copper homeostasis protein CutC [Actinomadura flavalba]|uniref:copper homeostasis protein CutC n=1 Tax=Actinomadura flavalba TaxID=1120938 RepID=UPI00035FA76D|nr:copper homeostasis protein CutC [Actinomadura flavalba]